MVILFIFGYLYFEFTQKQNFAFFANTPLNIIYLLIVIVIICNLPFLKGIISDIVKDKVETETLDKVKKYCFGRLREKPEIIIEMNKLLDEYRKDKSEITDKPQIVNLNLEGEKNDQKA